MNAEFPAARGNRAAPQAMFRIIRYFSIASFVCIVIAATALTAGFRYIAIREIVEIGEANGVALAEAALTSVRSDLLQFLAKADQANPALLSEIPLSPALAHEIDDVMRVKSVARIKIYNDKGWVVHATRRASIGTNQAGNPGVIAALSGNVASKLVYRDSFNAFDRRTAEDNLIQTYVPIVDAEDEPARGVFEIYTDVNPMVQHTEQAQLQLIGGGALIMALLYLALLAVVRHAERIITRQRNEIREHTATLERLSASMLNNQEDEKKRIAFDLHEGVAQTLSAVKMSVERAARQQALAGKGDAASLQPMVQAVKEAINEVRAVALNLRPSSLDGLGLIATIRWFCREFMKLHPDIVTEHAIGLAEDDVPRPLKIIVYRVLEEACRAIGRQADVTRVHVALAAADATIDLTIEYEASHELTGTDGADSDLANARERTLLSGGSFAISGNASGGRSVRASWLR